MFVISLKNLERIKHKNVLRKQQSNSKSINTTENGKTPNTRTGKRMVTTTEQTIEQKQTSTDIQQQP